MWQTVGQDRAVAALQRALRPKADPPSAEAGSRRAHAYLLAGPPQVGKATLARELAQALNCEGADPPCHECTPCRRIAAGIHADVQTVTVEAGDDAARRDISIDQVRELWRTVSLRAFEGRCRVIIIDPADAMSAAAQNAFLKTLEEPPPDVVFLLITSRPQMLRATIRSRCQRLDLKPLPVAAAQAALVERWGLPERRAELLARLSRGRLGWALAAQADEEILRLRRDALTDIRNLSRRGLVERFARAGDLALRFGRQREVVLDVLDLWGQWWRDVLLALGGCHEVITNVDLSDILRAEAAQYDVRGVANFLRSLAAARRRLEENVNPRLALEVLLLDLPAPR